MKKQKIKIGKFILEISEFGFSYWTTDNGKSHRWIIDASNIKNSGRITLNTNINDLPRFIKEKNRHNLTYKLNEVRFCEELK